MKSRYMKMLFATALLILLLTDLDPAINGIRQGINMCLCSVIPSLLPFLIVTKYLTGQLYGTRIPILSKLGVWCGIPEGMESILCIGLIGGYPMGAQLVTDAWEKKLLNQETAERMLGFCNNAGPAFIFGVCAALFPSLKISWCILLIQILSSLCCGGILPGKSRETAARIQCKNISFVHYFETTLVTMGRICGWILCFRVAMSYVEAYVPIVNPIVRAVVFGFLELTNGCVSLRDIPLVYMRFIIVNGMLSFGGMCVWMQSAGTVKGLSLKWFSVGKILQSILSISFAIIMGKFLFKTEANVLPLGVFILSAMVIAGVLCWKKVVAFLRSMLYNNQKNGKKRYHYAVSQEN